MSNPVSSILDILASLFGFRREQANRTNTPEMKANATAKVDAAVRDDATKAVAGDDLKKIREGAAE